jgi:hypothetical protein
MSRILLYDETAGAERFSSDSSKHANIGTGTATDRVAVNVTVFMTTGAQMTNGRSQPISVHPSSGSTASINPNSFSTVSTGLSRSPLACCDGGANRAVSLDFSSGTDCVQNQKIFAHFDVADVTTSGGIQFRNNDDGDPSGGTVPDCVLSAAATNYYYI